MNTTKICPHCKNIIDKNVTWCPYCGKMLSVAKIFVRFMIALTICSLIGIIIVLIFSAEIDTEQNKTNIENTQQEIENEENEDINTPKELTEEEYKAECQEYNYKNVLRYPESYIGNKIVLTVKITTVFSTSITNPTKYYFAYSESEQGSGYYWGDRYAIFDKRSNQGDLKLLEDDVIKVWGEIVEPEETTSLIVNSEELFCIDMKYVELISE